MWKTVAKVALATAAYGALHSVLASRGVKRASRRAVGPRNHDGLYRVAYNAVAAGGLVALAAYARRQPDRELYHVRGPAAALLRGGQLAALGACGWAAYHADIGKLSGLENLLAWLLGGPVPPVPEGQGPSPAEVRGRSPGGPFRYARQPLNAGLVALVWLNPRMTAGLLGFDLATLLYAVVGSLLTERRMRAAYGDDYEAYRAGGVPLLLPAAGPASQRGLIPRQGENDPSEVGT